jgi:hypothetical protein
MNKYFWIIAWLFIASACADKREKILSGNWQVSDVRFINIEAAMVYTDTINGNEFEINKLLMRESLMKNIYAFGADGTYKTGNAAASAEGKWKLKKNSVRFISQNSSIKPKEFKIEHLSDDSLVLNMQNDQTSVEILLVLTPIPNY